MDASHKTATKAVSTLFTVGAILAVCDAFGLIRPVVRSAVRIVRRGLSSLTKFPDGSPGNTGAAVEFGQGRKDTTSTISCGGDSELEALLRSFGVHVVGEGGDAEVTCPPGMDRKTAAAYAALHWFRCSPPGSHWSSWTAITNMLPVHTEHQQKDRPFINSTALLRVPELTTMVIRAMAREVYAKRANIVVSFDTRAMSFGVVVAYEAGISFVAVRLTGSVMGLKPVSEDMTNPEGYREEVHMVMDGFTFRPCDRVMIVDDVVCTGKTVEAVARLVKASGAEVVGCVTLADLQGNYNIVRIPGHVALVNLKVDELLGPRTGQDPASESPYPGVVAPTSLPAATAWAELGTELATELDTGHTSPPTPESSPPPSEEGSAASLGSAMSSTASDASAYSAYSTCSDSAATTGTSGSPPTSLGTVAVANGNDGTDGTDGTDESRNEEAAPPPSTSSWVVEIDDACGDERFLFIDFKKVPLWPSTPETSTSFPISAPHPLPPL
jgi:adenine phosphoribosyltransferase